MTTFFLIAEGDDQDLARRVQEDLAAMGFVPQARLSQADAVVALITPGALDAPHPPHLWDAALAANKPLVVVHTPPARPPQLLRGSPAVELDEDAYPLGLARLVQALLSQPQGGASYQVGVAVNSAVGEGATVINAPGGGPDLALLVRAVGHLARQRAQLAPDQAAALQAILADMQRQMAEGFGAIKEGQKDLADQLQLQQRMLLARLDAQERRLTEEILAVLESGAVAADELDRHLSAIEGAVVQLQAAHTELAPAAEVLTAPGLDVMHKLKVAIPIIPVLLTYEGEIFLEQGMNLEALWEKLKALAQ